MTNQELLAAVQRWAAEHYPGLTPASVSIKWTHPLPSVRLPVFALPAPVEPPAAVPDRPPSVPSSALSLSPLEEKVLAALTPGWRTAQELADATQEACSNHFRSILSNLGERCLLESSNSGYRQLPGRIPTPAPPCFVRTFSPDEEAIMAVASRDWQTAAEVASKAGMSKSSSFTAILANLVERGALESGRAGYRLPPGAERWREFAQSPPGRPATAPTRPPEVPSAALWLSPTEAKVLAALTADWKTTAEIATATGEANSSHFRTVLSNMRERGLMEGSNSGYRQQRSA